MVSRRRILLLAALLLAFATLNVMAANFSVLQPAATAEPRSAFDRDLADSFASRRQLLQAVRTEMAESQAFEFFNDINTATLDGPSVVWVRAGHHTLWL